MIVNIIAWIVLGAIAGWIAGLLVRGDERWGVIGHVVLGIVGAIVGGFIASTSLASTVAHRRRTATSTSPRSSWSIIGAVIVVWVVNCVHEQPSSRLTQRSTRKRETRQGMSLARFLIQCLVSSTGA